MGYAKPNQDAGGIHLRQFCRSVLVEDRLGSRILYVNLDNGMVSQLLRTRVLRRLKADFGEQTFNESNVMLSATHTHSCPGGFFQYMLYNIPSAGFISQTLEALTDGIVRSVSRAVASVQPGRIYLAKGELLDASINRSPTSYANNPAQERARYQHDTDKTMWLLRLVDRRQRPLAMLNWFAVHGTSMNNSNHLISSDNKGYAALLMEADFNQQQQQQFASDPIAAVSGLENVQPSRAGKQFVAIFAQANEGDVSPNTRGPRCIDTGLPCDFATSTCGNPPRNEKCIASGPGRDMFESTQMIAYKQYLKARQLFLDQPNQVQVRGPIRYVHEHIDMTKQVVPLYESVLALNKRHLEAQAAAVVVQKSNQAKQVLQPQQRNSNAAAAMRRRQDKQSAAQPQQQQQQQAVPLSPGQVAQQQTLQQAPIALNASYQTCAAGLGYSFAAGTTDGPGAFDFQQGDTVSTRYWNMVRDFLRRPSEEQVKCHHPKPILLSTGEMDFPYMWHPRVVPTQILMLGQVAIVGLPGEFTTMAGRRVRELVRATLRDQQLMSTSGFSSYPSGGGGDQYGAADSLDLDDDDAIDEDQNEEHEGGGAGDDDVLSLAASASKTNSSGGGGGDQRNVQLATRRSAARRELRRRRNNDDNNSDEAAKQGRRPQRASEVEVILSGLSNIYTSYVTTIEEYEVQRYEGASTLYGPHTLQAYLNQFRRLASLLVPSRSGPVPIDDHLQPPDLTKSLFTLKAGVIYDGAPHGKNFGDLLQDVDNSKSSSRLFKCRDQVSAAFVAGNPRNDLKQEHSFLYVDRFVESNKSWLPIASDASWETKFIWERTNTLFGESKATCQWDIPADCQTGVYRIRHLGAHKSLLQTVNQYAGKSTPFRVLAGGGGGNESQNHSNSTPAELAELNRVQRVAEQVEEAQAAAAAAAAAAMQQSGGGGGGGGEQQASQPKADTGEQSTRLVGGGGGGPAKSDRQLGSIFTAPLRYLSSLARWKW